MIWIRHCYRFNLVWFYGLWVQPSSTILSAYLKWPWKKRAL